MSISIQVWGNNIWYLFHTIAYKIKEESFPLIKNDLIEIVKNICSHLPCPDCSKDAVATINKINFNAINTKEDFKIMLFNFHNYVNRKLNKPEYQYENIDNKYKNANINNLLHNFNLIFSSNSSNPHMMSDSFSRKLILPKINNLIKKIIIHMD